MITCVQKLFQVWGSVCKFNGWKTVLCDRKKFVVSVTDIYPALIVDDEIMFSIEMWIRPQVWGMLSVVNKISLPYVMDWNPFTCDVDENHFPSAVDEYVFPSVWKVWWTKIRFFIPNKTRRCWNLPSYQYKFSLNILRLNIVSTSLVRILSGEIEMVTICVHFHFHYAQNILHFARYHRNSKF